MIHSKILILIYQMNPAENNILRLRYWIRDEFTGSLSTQCNIRARQCRGGSSLLYKLLVSSPSSYQYIRTDKDNLQIVSGMGHTFIRYKDLENQQYIYIDPTIAQFIPSFDGIFVGSANELLSMDRTRMPGSQLDVKDYVEDPQWTGVTYPPLTIESGLMSGGRRKKRVKTRAKRK